MSWPSRRPGDWQGKNGEKRKEKKEGRKKCKETEVKK